MSIYELTLKKKELICDDVMVFDFETKDGLPITFKAGQYINIFLDSENKNSGHQGRSYTLMPTQNGARLAVRKMGEFSTALHNLDTGTKVIADGPHGSLYPRDTQHSFVCIAAGIGIAPFVGWLQEFETRIVGGEELQVQFLISNGFKRRSPFLNMFSSLEKSRIITSLFFTKERPQSDLMNSKEYYRRINLSDIEKAVHATPDADFAVCGSIGFTRDMWKILKQVGVPEERIFTEAFF